MPAYHLENFGCRASRADGEAIAADLRSRGLSAAGHLAHAEVVVLNTCSVTAEADKDARAFVRKARRANPSAHIVVTGCYAQRAPEEVQALPGVDRVIGNSHKALVAEAAADLLFPDFAPAAPSARRTNGLVPLQALLLNGKPLVDSDFAHADLASAAFIEGAAGQLTRPNLKIQDGCGNRCSFCIIPQTRGGSRSLPLERVLTDVRHFTDAGGQEMVLSGINLGRWGRDLQPQQRFEDLVEAVLVQTALPRLRISSVEPMDWTDRLLDLFRAFGRGDAPRLARHAHLPLQSGSDTVLRAMYRRYRPWHYAARLASIREALPDAAIGADVMVGFPGETDALFAETYRFVERQPFTYLHLFPFSARPGTPAWALHQQHPVAPEKVRERMARLQALAEEKHHAFRSNFVGSDLSVVTLQTPGQRRALAVTRALSDNFLTVEIHGNIPANRMLRVSVAGTTANGLRAAAADEAVHKMSARFE